MILQRASQRGHPRREDVLGFGSQERSCWMEGAESSGVGRMWVMPTLGYYLCILLQLLRNAV